MDANKPQVINDAQVYQSVRNLRNMRAFYAAFPKRNALRSELSWTHYRLLMRVADADVRQWYADEAAY